MALWAGTPLAIQAAQSLTTTTPLSQIARLYSMKISSAGRKIILKNKWNTIEVETNSRRIWINGTLVWLHIPTRKTVHGWVVPEIDFKKTIDPIMRSYAFLPATPPHLIVLDPGHGGKDSGAIGKRKVYEKLAVLSIAKRVKAHLEAKKIKVKMTRSTDTYLTLQQRSAFAAKAGASLFVSIHADSAGTPSAHGVETFVMTAAGGDSSNYFGQPGDKTPGKGNYHDPANAILGFALQSNLVKTTHRSDRGLRRARYAVLKNAPCPAALVECGFLSNPEEEALMIDPKYRETIAHGISNGLFAYLTLARRVRKK
jgi:N-acetylmuramoyl-L-alanine amidase